MGNVRKQRRKNNKMIAQQRRRKEDDADADADERCLANLSQHVIVQILAKLPHEQLYDLRRACKSWSQIISDSRFIARDFQRSTPALLVQVPCFYRPAFRTKVLEFGGEGLGFELCRVGPKRRMGLIKSVSNGLILLLDDDVLAVANMATGCRDWVPGCPSECEHEARCLALAFDARAKRYKVVHVGPLSWGVEIFTLGCPKNQWKVVPSSHRGRMHGGDRGAPVFSNGRFLHWDVSSNAFVVSMDACDETTWETPLPLAYYLSFDANRYSLVELRGSLCLMYSYSSAQLDAWLLEDVAGQVWRRSFSILAETVNYSLPDGTSPGGEWRNALPDFEKLIALCSLRDGDIIVFQHKSSLCLYVYETKLKELRKLSKIPAKDNEIFAFKSSLVHWENDEQLFARETI